MAALLWVIVGCGSNSSSTAPRSTPASSRPSTPTSRRPVARTPRALKSSLDALKNVDVQQDGVAALTSALADVKTELGAATASASSALQPEVQQVQTAVDGSRDRDERADHQQPHPEGTSHRHGAEAGRDRHVGPVDDALAELSRQLAWWPGRSAPDGPGSGSRRSFVRLRAASGVSDQTSCAAMR